jgi:predicted amidohydrolase
MKHALVRSVLLTIGCLAGFPLTAAAADRSFVVAALKVMPAIGDKAANLARFEQLARQGAAAGADLIVTPECYLDGYMGSPVFRPGMTREKMMQVHTETIDGPMLRNVAALARELKVHILFGFSKPDGALGGHYSKSHPLPGELYDAGGELPVFDTALGRMGVLICFDRQPPENARILALKGAQFIVVPAYGKVRVPMDEDVLMQARAHENGIYIIYTSQHNAFVAGPDGVITAQAHSDDCDMLMFGRVVLDGRIHDRGAYRVRHPELYGPLVAPSAPKK